MSVACERCGKRLLDGALKYNVSIRITADWDERLPEDAGLENPEALVARMTTRPTDDLEDEVDQALAFVVCPSCRKALLKDPLARRTQ